MTAEDLRDPPISTAAAVSYRQVLTSRNVPQLLLAACLCRLAHGMLALAVVLYAMARFDSAGVAGLAVSLLTLPGFLVSPLAGAVLDRMGALAAVVTDTVASAALVGGVAALSLAGRMTPALLYVLLALFSLTTPLTDGGLRTLFPRFVPDAAYDRANALDVSTYAVIEVTGPLAAGALFAAAGPDATLLVVTGMYVLAGFGLALLRGGTGGTAQEGRTARGGRELLRSAREGVGYLVRHATLRGLAVAYSVYQMAYGMLAVIVPVAVGRWVGGGDAVGRCTGGLWAVTGLCGGLGALVAGRLVTAGAERRFMAAALLASTAALYPLAALGSLGTLGAGLALFGVLEGVVNVCLLSLRQRRTAPGRLGRVMTVSISVNLMGYPVGTALGGVLVSAGSPRTALAVAAGVTLCAAACARLLLPAEG